MIRSEINLNYIDLIKIVTYSLYYIYYMDWSFKKSDEDKINENQFYQAAYDLKTKRMVNWSHAPYTYYAGIVVQTTSWTLFVQSLFDWL